MSREVLPSALKADPSCYARRRGKTSAAARPSFLKKRTLSWASHHESRSRPVGVIRKKFFFEKKNQKTLADAVAAHSGGSTPSETKVFCFFSSENKTFLQHLPRQQRRAAARAGNPGAGLPNTNAGGLQNICNQLIHRRCRLAEGGGHRAGEAGRHLDWQP